MRAINYLKNSFEYALKGNGRLNITQNHIDALNEVIEHFNKTGNEDVSERNLSEALALFYVLQIWKIDNKNGKLHKSQKRQGIMELSNPYYLLEKLFMMLNPKERVMDELFTEIRAHQLLNDTPKEKMIKKSEMRKLIDGLLDAVRNFKSYEYIKNFKI